MIRDSRLNVMTWHVRFVSGIMQTPLADPSAVSGLATTCDFLCSDPSIIPDHEQTQCRQLCVHCAGTDRKQTDQLMSSTNVGVSFVYVVTKADS